MRQIMALVLGVIVGTIPCVGWIWFWLYVLSLVTYKCWIQYELYLAAYGMDFALCYPFPHFESEIYINVNPD